METKNTNTPNLQPNNENVKVSKWTKFKYFLKSKVLTKSVGFTALGIVTVAGVSGALAYKYTKEKFKPVFYNYQSYMDPFIIEKLNKKFEYKEFGTINEFSKAILTHKTAGGIGNDGQAAKLIINDYTGKSKLRKFTVKDFKKIYGQNWNDALSVSENLKQILTPIVFNHLASYDQYFEDIPIYEPNGKPKLKADGTQFYNKDYENNEDKIHLYNYFIPYFAQDMVIAYNPLKLSAYNKIYKSPGKDEPEDKDSDSYKKYLELYTNSVASYFESITKDLETQINKDLYKIYNNPEPLLNHTIPMIDALKTIRNPFGPNNDKDAFKYYEYTDAVRDNMVYGSSYRLNTETGKHLPQPSGGAIVHEKTDLTQREVVTTIYKDLIDQFLNLFKDGTGYKITNTKHVRTSGNGQDLLNTLIDPEKITNVGIIYNGDALDAFYSRDNISNSDVPDGAIRFIRPSVNLLLVDGLVISEDTNEETAQTIIESSKDTFLGGLDKKESDWTEEKVNQAVDDASSQAYKDYGSFLNFDYVRYTPAFNLVYNYAYENTFNDPLIPSDDPKYAEQNEYQKNYARNLYKIENEYTIGHKDTETFKGWHEFTYNVQHVAISPVDQKVQTMINTYYEQQLKA
ncbi:type 2 periplasmic-binding domain-containing protein [Mycoplasmopsis felifaucium]|uniref:hypothetical protein n=1 Tax=Mycoplasmopsis felifaucium TaxID=35768 RepID=UPI0006908333|nr:hypothetical protein [Mycoplasmopsis felifaucium]